MPKRKTQEEFVIDFYNKLGYDYELLSPYTGSHGKVMVKHVICGNSFEKNTHDILTKGSGCPYCNGAQPAKYNETWVINNTPSPYKYVEGYINMTNKCKFYCNNCHQYFLQTPQRLINKHLYGCNCCPTKKISHNDFLNMLGEDCLDEYEIQDTYINSDTPMQFKHKICGAVFKISPYKFIHRHNKHYCPICYYNKSHGEILINQFLLTNNIEYQKEFIFPQLPNKKFDFYLPKLRTAIEFDGQQHFEPVEFFGGTNKFQQQQERDKIKNQFCLLNNITLYRIPYTEINNINQILTEIFKEKSSTTIERFKITEQSTLQANGNGNG